MWRHTIDNLFHLYLKNVCKLFPYFLFHSSTHFFITLFWLQEEETRRNQHSSTCRGLISSSGFLILTSGNHLNHFHHLPHFSLYCNFSSPPFFPSFLFGINPMQFSISLLCLIKEAHHQPLLLFLLLFFAPFYMYHVIHPLAS